MKKLVIGGAVFVVAMIVLHRFAPSLHERAMKKCMEMRERMADRSPLQRTGLGTSGADVQHMLSDLDAERECCGQLAARN